MVGASFGGWIAAEIATMASHRLASLTLIDPVGIKVEGWIYPFLFGMDCRSSWRPIFQNPMAALALAPPGHEPSTRWPCSTARAPRSRAWRGTRISTIRCCAGGWRASRAPTLLCWGAHDRLAPLAPCARDVGRGDPGAALRVFDGFRPRAAPGGAGRGGGGGRSSSARAERGRR